MKKSYWIFFIFAVFLTALHIYGDEDCEKRKCIKRIKDVLQATYVLIDPGHGGMEHGADGIDGETKEKDLNLVISKFLRNRLIQLGIKNVELTREADITRETEFVRPERIKELLARAKKKFENECEEFYPIFISIHQNGHENKKAKGTEP